MPGHFSAFGPEITYETTAIRKVTVKSYVKQYLIYYASGNFLSNMSCFRRKPAFCICKNKDADQLRSNREADQLLCFRYLDSTIPLLPKSAISKLYPSPEAVQPGLCRTWSETQKTGFLTTRLIYKIHEMSK